MTTKAGGGDAGRASPQGSSADLMDALKALIQEETSRALAEVTKKLDARAAETPRGATPDIKKLVDEIVGSATFRDRVNGSLEQGLRNVLPQIVQRMKQEIEDRLKTKPGGGSESVSVKTVVNSIEMKEMLEDRFRTMLLYLKQEVIPKELQRLGVQT